MRRIHTLLVLAGLAAAPTSALAGPSDSSDSRDRNRSTEVFEWSMGKGRLGIVLIGLTPELRTYFGATSSAGVLVARVDPDSPAAKAGIRVGDVLTKANGQEVDDAGDVRAEIATAKKGDAIDLAIIRDRKPVNLKAVLTDAAGPPMPRIESFWSTKDWFRDFMKSFEELKKQSQPSTST